MPLLSPPVGPVPWDLVLLDRDGTLNVRRPGYVARPADLRLRPGAAGFVGALTAAGMRTVLVTNQRGIATGALTEDDLAAVHSALIDRLARAGGRLDGIEVCPHQIGTCTCRKPLPGMLLNALARAPWADPRRVVMVGDQSTDREAARAAGVAWLDVGVDGLTLREAGRVLTGRSPDKGVTPVLPSSER